ncbi:50S ribosomal protein L9 [Cyanobacterium aponinum FACHB-4101]|uniref:50S ribosomal protein L9 n=1 Tax=Cyanobacterium aponinum TaxID=379064 RepID=UPI001680FAAF|nr:50S ribosomal protein L9 [Cyanobacterium aponinum]MBD2393569.1 50S ribosomal protein L9 [Cyanobacterium aponinum FACHB-4101]
MAQKVQLLLNKNVEKLGKRGDVVDVAPGYARNYLVPQGFAVVVTPGILRQVEQRKEKERQRLQAILEEAKSRKTALQTINNFVIRKQVGEQEAIFGTVTTQDVVDVIKQSAGLDIERQDITVPEIKKTGKYSVSIKLHTEVTAEITVEVAPL